MVCQEFEDQNNSPPYTATLKSRAGKATGKFRHQWNTIREDGSNYVTDFSQVYSWKLLKESTETTNNDERQRDIAL